MKIAHKLFNNVNLTSSGEYLSFRREKWDKTKIFIIYSINYDEIRIIAIKNIFILLLLVKVQHYLVMQFFNIFGAFMHLICKIFALCFVPLWLYTCMVQHVLFDNYLLSILLWYFGSLKYW